MPTVKKEVCDHCGHVTVTRRRYIPRPLGLGRQARWHQRALGTHEPGCSLPRRLGQRPGVEGLPQRLGRWDFSEVDQRPGGAELHRD